MTLKIWYLSQHLKSYNHNFNYITEEKRSLEHGQNVCRIGHILLLLFLLAHLISYITLNDLAQCKLKIIIN